VDGIPFLPEPDEARADFRPGVTVFRSDNHVGLEPEGLVQHAAREAGEATEGEEVEHGLLSSQI
jgi:hypothetical protein